MMEANPLVETFPEAEGVSSADIRSFIDKIEKHGMNLHSFILMRNHKVLAEGYQKPFHKDTKHRMYSVSKTFVSTAIGLLCDEGKLSLSDKIVTFFPEKVTEKTHHYIMEMTIRDLLMMATPFNGTTYTAEDYDWISTFFSATPTHPAGTVFNYDTSASYILNVIVERVTKMSFLEYMRPRLLDQIGFSKDAWCVKAPEGNSWGGSGVICTARDLAKFASVWLNQGSWQGNRLISQEYVRQASTRQIDNCIRGFREYDRYGYGYQIWITRDNSFSFLGMGSQYAICVPEKDLLLVCTGDTQGMQGTTAILFDLFWDCIVDKVSETPLECDVKNEFVQEKYSLQIPSLMGQLHSAHASIVDGVTYKLYPNDMGITELTLHLKDNEGVLEYRNEQGDKKLKFGIGKYVEDLFPQTGYSAETAVVPSEKLYQCASFALWTEEHKLVINTYIIDHYLGNMTTTISFKGDEIGILMTKTAEWFLEEYAGFAGGYVDRHCV